MSELRDTATVTTSSNYSGDYVGAKAVDGDPYTSWSSASEGNAAWIQFTWPEPVTLREITLYARSENWGNVRVTFADASYMDLPAALAETPKVLPLRRPVTTTSVRISVAPHSAYTTGNNSGFREVYLNDAYTTPPSNCDFTWPDFLTASSELDSNDWRLYRVLDQDLYQCWCCNAEGANAWVQWNYTLPVTIEFIKVRDRWGSNDVWGIPRFTFDDATYQDGTVVASKDGYTTYWITPKSTTTLRISVASGSSGNYIGLSEVRIGRIDPARLQNHADVTASTQYNTTTFSADHAVDGNLDTEWACAGEGGNAWIELTWPQPVSIAEIAYRARPCGEGLGQLRFTFSDNTYVDSFRDCVSAVTETRVLMHPKTTTSLKITSILNASGANPGFSEISISSQHTVPITTDMSVPDVLTYFPAFGINWRGPNVLPGVSGEWATWDGESGAWIQYNYTEPVLIESLQILDREGTERWGIPRFTFDDASYQDGGEAVSNTGLTTYTLTPKATTSLRISIASGSSGTNIGLAEVVITGNVDTGGGGSSTVWVSGTVAQAIG